MRTSSAAAGAKGLAVDLPIPSGTYGIDTMHTVDQSTHYGFSAGTTISRTAFGVSYGVPLVSDEVRLQLEAQFVDPGPA